MYHEFCLNRDEELSLQRIVVGIYGFILRQPLKLQLGYVITLLAPYQPQGSRAFDFSSLGALQPAVPEGPLPQDC